MVPLSSAQPFVKVRGHVPTMPYGVGTTASDQHCDVARCITVN